jgi:acetylglutamate kinase
MLMTNACSPDLLQRLVMLSVGRLQGKRVVIKVGGSLLVEEQAVLQDVIWLGAMGAHPVLVHGGGPSITAWLQKRGVPPCFENGLRVTDAQTLEVVRMVLLGQVNPALVLHLVQLGARAIGLSGHDGKMVRARIVEERLGLVGQVELIDPTPIESMLAKG